LDLITKFEEFLNDVVPKDIRHKLKGVWRNLIKDSLLFGTRCSFELLLNEPRAMLITTKLDYVTEDILKDQMSLNNR
jgi:hypothetical protein